MAVKTVLFSGSPDAMDKQKAQQEQGQGQEQAEGRALQGEDKDKQQGRKKHVHQMQRAIMETAVACSVMHPNVVGGCHLHRCACRLV